MRPSQTTGIDTLYAAVAVRGGPVAFVRVALPLTAIDARVGERSRGWRWSAWCAGLGAALVLTGDRVDRRSIAGSGPSPTPRERYRAGRLQPAGARSRPRRNRHGRERARRHGARSSARGSPTWRASARTWTRF